MDVVNSESQCVNCGNSEMVVPLISVRYAGEQIWICSPCMPILIHKREQMINTLECADKIPPSAYQH